MKNKEYLPICVCIRNSKTSKGSEGYVIHHKYSYERKEQGLDGKPYYRVYPEESDYYETCSPYTFRKYFRKLDKTFIPRSYGINDNTLIISMENPAEKRIPIELPILGKMRSWHDPSVIPAIRMDDPSISIDVLLFAIKKRTHYFAWYSFKEQVWLWYAPYEIKIEDCLWTYLPKPIFE